MNRNEEKVVQFELNSAAVLTTSISNVIVTKPVEIQLNFKTPVAADAAKIVVWKGLAVPYGNLDSYIYSQSIASSTSGSVTIHKEDISFSQGAYTIGYCVGGDTYSVSACVSILNGQPLQYQETSLYLLNMVKASSNIVLTVCYSTPNGNTPMNNRDWIELFKGDTPQKNNYFKYFPIQSNNSADTMLCYLNLGDLTYENKYILEFNPGYSAASISATYAFTFNQ